MTTQFSFGSGNAFAVPLSGITDTTPIQFGTLQDISVDFDFTMKDLMGQFQFPVASARASGKITGKAKLATFSARALNLIFGSSVTTGSQINTQVAEAGAVTSATYTAANSATFLTDLGVYYASTGKAFTKVTSSPTVGQYSVSGSGVYTFNTTDTGSAILVSYTYTLSTSGNEIVISNQLSGQQPVTSLVLSEGYNSQLMTLKLNSVIYTKLSLDFKNDDFTVPELDFSAFADAANNIGSISLATP